MAGTDASRVLVGAPDQSGVSGAISRAPRGTVMPTDARTPLDVAFKSGGFVSPDGVTVTPSFNTSAITDWSGATVRKLLESFDGTVDFSFIQMSEDEAKLVFGEANVVTTAATATSGKQLAIKIGANLPDPGGWVFKMKDGKALIRIVLPDAQPTSVASMAFTPKSAIPLGATLSCYPDAAGYSIYIYTDDGVFAA